ncbi:DUF4886 domain-containing protein [candidate division KSB1 bacterium]
MNKPLIKNIASAAVLILALLGTAPECDFGPDTSGAELQEILNVLFLGDGFTNLNDLPFMLLLLVEESQTKPLMAVNSSYGGTRTLEVHWDDVRTRDVLQNGSWDYVVLQEQLSHTIDNREKMFEYARKFDAEIKKIGGNTIFYLTFANRDRPEMQAELNEAYFEIAQELGALIAPVGIAFEKAYSENQDIMLHETDGFYPSRLGSYLAACVFYAVIYNKNPEGLPNSLVMYSQLRIYATEAEAAFLQRIAWETVQEYSNHE